MYRLATQANAVLAESCCQKSADQNVEEKKEQHP
jgi:hypothetical protein